MLVSDTYDAIIEKGELREAHKILLLQGRRRLGAPDAKSAAELRAITDLGRLEKMAEQILDAGSWEELLSAPRPRRRKRTS